MGIKNKLLDHCWYYLNQRLATLTKAMDEVKQAGFEETKRTAGDKHETGLAMMQLEQEKLATQIADISQIQQVLERINLALNNGIIGEGSLVLTSQANYFIGISAGKAEIDGKTYFLVSPMSPIGTALMGHKEGEKLNFRGQSIEVLGVF
jgi:hypothetical protein